MTGSVEFGLDVLETRMRVNVPDERYAAQLARLWSCFVPVPAVDTMARREIVIDVDTSTPTVAVVGATERADGTHDRIVDLISMVMNREALAGFDGLAIHAGVIALGGRAVVLPGASGAGKSTLTAACLRASWDYVSDEALCLAWGSAAISPYPKPIALSAHSQRLAGVVPGNANRAEKTLFPPSELGRVVSGDLEVAHVVALVRRPGQPSLNETHRADAISTLLPRCFNHYLHPAEALQTLGTLARNARSWRLDYDDPTAAASLLAETLG